MIPFVTDLGPDGTIIAGPYKGQSHYYKTALYNILLWLKPKTCLEIGTLHGGTAQVFERYFREQQPHGLLISVDIKLYVNLNLDRVVQVKWYPHVEYFNDLHNVSESDLLPDGAKRWRDSVKLNTHILREELYRLQRPCFDFTFIDGDHRTVSVEKDIAIARALSRPPHYILLEDVREGLHEVSSYYENEVNKTWQHYDFQDWPVLSGAALIWEA